MDVLTVLGEPPTAAEIAARRREVGDGRDAGMTAMFMCPVPLLDIAVGAAAMAADHAWNGEERAALADAPGAVARDWSSNRLAEAYAAKVRAQGRELVAGEVAALERAARYQGMVANVAGAVVGGIVDGVVDGVTGAVGRAFGTPSRK